MKPVEQRRASPRSHTRLKGQVIYNNGLSRLDCTVRNLSETGARLVFAPGLKVPGEFELQIPGKKLARRAQVMWYDGQNHGIMFLGGGSGADERTTSGLTGPWGSDVPDILEEARQQIARLLGVSIATIQVKVEFER